MKKYIYRLLSLTILATAFMSCSKEVGIDNKTKNAEEFTVKVSMEGVTRHIPTYAHNISAEVKEKAITCMTALLFNADDNDKFIETADVQLGTVTEATGEFDTQMEATFNASNDKVKSGDNVKFALVANITKAKMDSYIETKARNERVAIGSLTLADIKKLGISEACDEPYLFPMVSVNEGLVQVQRNNTQSVSDIMKMERLAARIDVLIGDNARSAGLEVETVLLKGKRIESFLYEKGGDPSGYQLGHPQNETYTDSPFVAKIYTYESANNDCKLEVDLSINQHPLKKFEIKLDTPIERNHIYKVTIDRDEDDVNNPDTPIVNESSLKFMVDVYDWNIDDYYDELYEVSAIPRIMSMVSCDENWAEYNLEDNYHSFLGDDKQIVEVSSYLPYNMELKILSGENKAKAKILEGSEWLSCAEETSSVDGEQTFRIQLTKNEGPKRCAKIELASDAYPNNSRIIKIYQQEKVPFFEHICQYDVMEEGAFNESDCDGQYGVMVFDKAYPLFKNTVINGKRYHMPSVLEVAYLLPVTDKIVNTYYKHPDVLDNPEEVKIYGKVGNYTADYRVKEINSQRSCTYALRFKDADNENLSAWKYEYVDIKDERVAGGSKFIVSYIYLGPEFTGDIETISNKEFWKENASKVLTREFLTSDNYNTSQSGYRWTTDTDGDKAYCMHFSKYYAFAKGKESKNYKRVHVRLFAN